MPFYLLLLAIMAVIIIAIAMWHGGLSRDTWGDIITAILIVGPILYVIYYFSHH